MAPSTPTIPTGPAVRRNPPRHTRFKKPISSSLADSNDPRLPKRGFFKYKKHSKPPSTDTPSTETPSTKNQPQQSPAQAAAAVTAPPEPADNANEEACKELRAEISATEARIQATRHKINAMGKIDQEALETDRLLESMLFWHK
ncbi:hypothetical protein ABW21_db0201469 [Orbilia brochopaga]|nr:hypothetical protein ABW21_db0201469 [Drechslerella brochopaga]